MNIITLNRVLLNNTPLNYRRKRILTEKDFYFKTIERTFTFSKSAGGKSIKDGRAYIKRIKGNSVVWNQLYKPIASVIRTQTINGITFSVYEDGTIEANGTAEGGSAFISPMQYRGFLSSHKYLLIAYGAPAGEWSKQGLYFVGITGLNEASMIKSAAGYKIFQPSADGSSTLTLTAWDGYSLSCRIRPIFIDLTKAFPNDWQNINTIEDFNARVTTLGVDMNAYNEGQVIHCNTESIKSVGDNAWDEEWVLGRLNTDTGQSNPGSNGIHTKNYNKVLPNEVYYCGYNDAPIFAMFFDAEYNLITQVSGSNNFINIRSRQFTTPTNAVYMKFYVVDITTYNNDILISLYHSGWKAEKDDQYQPYWQDTLPLPIIRKYFPDGMVGGTDASGNRGGDIIYYDKASKKWYAQTNMLLLNLDMSNVGVQASNIADYTTFLIPADNANQCKTYGAGAMFNNYGLQTDTYYGPRRIYTTWDNKVSISIPSTMASDVGELQALYQQMPLIVYAELAEPIVTELDAEDQNFRDYYNVADFGTEMSQSEVPSAALLADVGYYFKKSEVKELTLN